MMQIPGRLTPNSNLVCFLRSRSMKGKFYNGQLGINYIKYRTDNNNNNGNIHMLFLQETRSPNSGVSHGGRNGEFIVAKSAAVRGQYGCETWVTAKSALY